MWVPSQTFLTLFLLALEYLDLTWPRKARGMDSLVLGLAKFGGCRRIDGAMGGTGRQVPRPFHTEHIGGQALCI